MSGWDPQKSFYEVPVPAHADSGRKWWVIALVIAGMLGLSFVGCTGALVYWAVQRQTVTYAEPQRPSDEEVRRQLTTVRRALSKRELKLSREEQGEIRRLFDQVIAAGQADEGNYREHIDVSRMVRGIRESRYWPSRGLLASFDDLLLQSSVREALETSGHWYWERYQLTHVERLSDNEAVVYGYFWSGRSTDAMRWWIVRSGRRWKVYDWEHLDYGLSYANEWALYHRYEADPRLQTYFDAVGEARELNTYTDSQQPLDERLRELEQRQAPPILQEQLQLELVYTWLRNGYPHEALRLIRSTGLPRSVPGFQLAEALAYNQLDRPHRIVDAAERYEQLLGQGPEIAVTKARAYESLFRPDEAAAVWKRLLKLDPDDTVALQSFARCLAPEEKQQLIPHIERTSDPVETTVQLFHGTELAEDPAVEELLVGLLERIAPDSSRLLYVRGRLLSRRKAPEAAAELFWQAYEQEKKEGRRGEYLHAYFDAMADAGRALEAYQEARDSAAAFDYFAEAWWDEGRLEDETFRRLIEAHRQQMPDDPDIEYYSAQLAMGNRDYQQAFEHLARVIEIAPDDFKPVARPQQIRCLIELGNSVPKVVALEPRQESIQQAASIYWQRGMYAELDQLVMLWQEEFPDDPQLRIYQNLVTVERGDRDAGLSLLEQLWLQGLDDLPELKYSIWYRMVQLSLASDDPSRIYRRLPDESLFDELAAHLQDREAWQHLETLLALHEQKGEPRSERLLWQMRLYWNTQQYDRLVDLLPLVEPNWAMALEPNSLEEARMLITRSLLRLGRVDAARELATAAYEADGDARPLAIVSAVSGQFQETARYLNEIKVSTSADWQFYNDEDLGPILLSEPFEPMREQYPMPLPWGIESKRLVLFFEQPFELTLEKVKQAARAAFPDPQIEPYESPSGELTSAFVVKTGDSLLIVGTGPGTYQLDFDGEPHRAVQNLLENSSQWIAVAASVQPGNQPGELERLVDRLGARLLNEHTTLVYQDDPSWVFPAAPELQAALEQSDRAQLQSLGHEQWLYYDPGPAATEQQPPDRHKLLTALRQLERGERDTPLTLYCEVEVAHATERLVLEAVRVRRHGWNVQVTGRLKESAKLLPNVKVGDYVSFDDSDVVGIREE